VYADVCYIYRLTYVEDSSEKQVKQQREMSTAHKKKTLTTKIQSINKGKISTFDQKKIQSINKQQPKHEDTAVALQYLYFCTRSQYLYFCTSNSRSTSRTTST
jgi:hypothetical protein